MIIKNMSLGYSLTYYLTSMSISFLILLNGNAQYESKWNHKGPVPSTASGTYTEKLPSKMKLMMKAFNLSQQAL